MDRWRARARAPRRGVPRPRGDGPIEVAELTPDGKCSPPARGWTVTPGGRAVACPVFPARAGMDRWRAWCSTPPSRVPRPRGDGPYSAPLARRVVPCSPPARGWTGVSRSARERGKVFPARAGMDRNVPARGTGAGRVPRPRGDGPIASGCTSVTNACSPPARGWTGTGLQTPTAIVVFPARAGMDRRQPGTACRGSCVPRPRGDGPYPFGSSVMLVSCSPPARGWTVGGRRHAIANHVFPARAGMDRRPSTR